MICDDSWKLHDTSLINEINNKSFEINDLKVQLKYKTLVVNELKHRLAKLHGKRQVSQRESSDFDSRIQKIEDENVSLAFQIESELINAYFKNNMDLHQDYMKVTNEYIETLHELLEQARAFKPLDENLVYACKFAEHIRELLVYVSDLCPFTQSGNEKRAPATSHKNNNKPYVDASQKIVSYTDASGSKPKRNTKNDRIHRPSSESKKNKVEAQPRKFKSSLNKNNHVSDCNVNIKNVTLLKNSVNICLSCNECLFSKNHDACVVKYLKGVQKRKKAKSIIQNEKIQWKPTEAGRTMLIFPKSLLSLWAKAVATACYTQNRLLIHPRYNKTPNELLRDCKPELKYLHVFGALCYLTNDSKDLGKLKPKADIRIFIGYSPSKRLTGSTTKGPE
ncbi:retrovirus-related pol polyprotein from transposon TNT 1-94 [Tanacetum coccineum]